MKSLGFSFLLEFLEVLTENRGRSQRVYSQEESNEEHPVSEKPPYSRFCKAQSGSGVFLLTALHH